jgi:hypothetical protein
MYYPDKWHPCYFLVDALNALGADAEFVKDERTLDCWGMQVNGKIVVYLIDNRWPHEREKEDPAAATLLARGALVCCAQRPDAERVGAKWLPLAVTPGYRMPDKPSNKAHDVAMIGYVRDIARARLLTDVKARFSLCVEQGVFGDSAVEAYWSARVGLNIPTNYGDVNAYDSANMRCFEVLATGTPLVTPHEDYLAALGIEDGITCLTYRTADGALAAIRRLVDNPELATQIGANGAKLAAARHTYEHRARTVLEWLA